MRSLGIKNDKNLTCKIHMQDFISKLNTDNVVLSKLKYIINFEILRPVDFALFQSHVSYLCIL